MPFREGLIAGRGQIVWILLLALSSGAILHIDLSQNAGSPASRQTEAPTAPPG